MSEHKPLDEILKELTFSEGTGYESDRTCQVHIRTARYLIIKAYNLGTEHAEQERNALAAYVHLVKEALRDQLNDCINFDGGKLTDIIMEHSSKVMRMPLPLTALTVLKAQWQAEAIEDAVKATAVDKYDLSLRDACSLLSYADDIRQRAQEASGG